MKTYIIRSAILSLLVNAAFVWLVNDALADGLRPDYYSIAAGKTKLQRNQAEGWWNQTGSDQIYSEDTNSWAMRAGWNVSDDWSIEAGWRDLGKFSMAASFISDDAHDRLMAGQCTYPCGEQPAREYATSYAYGAEVRAKYHPFKLMGARPYIAIGALHRHTTYYVYNIDPQANGKIYAMTSDWSETFTRPTHSIGVDFSNWFIEYTLDRYVSTRYSAVNKAMSISIGARF